MTKPTEIKSVLISFFVLIFVLDLYLFGGGRVIEVYGLTLRMILFAIALLLSFFVLLKTEKISRTLVFCFSIFLVIILYSSYITSIDGDIEFSSISAYLFVLNIFFFYTFKDKVFNTVERIVPFAALLMSVLYLSFLALVFFEKLSFLDVYTFIPESELFLRGQEGLVYKGFLYLLIGALYFVIVDRFGMFNRIVFFTICFLAIAATLTRGFMISLLLVVFLYYYFNLRNNLIKFSLVFFLVSVLIFTLTMVPHFFLREGSDSTRLNDIFEFLNFINTGGYQVIFGKGISGYLGSRPSIENAYMDVWFRFGFIGLVVLILILVKIALDYQFLKKKHDNVKAIQWLYYSVVLIFIQSNFNPYVNNYIGGTFVIFVLIFFDAERQSLNKKYLSAESKFFGREI
ncbi:hypothetical protein ACV1D2_13385 [Aeromonas caviae]|jgi:hypothetical protein